MALIDKLADIGDAIREKTGKTDLIPLSAMPDEIRNIPQDVPEVVHFREEEGVSWYDDEKWQLSGEAGTTLIFDVGNDLAPLLSATLYLQNVLASDPATVDWGDGTTVTLPANTTAQRIYHKYEQPGEYIVRITDKIKKLGISVATIPDPSSLANVIIRNSCYAIRQIVNYGTKITDLMQAFYDCPYINSNVCDQKYSVDYPPFPPNILIASSCYQNCSRYTGRIPKLVHLTKCISIYNCFYNNQRATGNVQRLPPNVTASYQIYYGCYELTDGIPYDFFHENAENVLTACYGAFQGCRKLVGEFPRINHLKKATSFTSMFYGCHCIGEDCVLPEPPQNTVCTTLGHMFRECYAASLYGDFDQYADAMPNNKSLYYTFYNCLNARFHISKVNQQFSKDGLQCAFASCRNITGTFPAIPSNYTGQLYNTFYYCQSLEGSLPDLPTGATDLKSTFSECRNATGKFPSLSNLSCITAGANCTYTFSSCLKVTQEPDEFFIPNNISAQTSFAGMFAYCNGLSSWSHDLSLFPKITTTAEMFRECSGLKHHNMTVPPNTTSMSYMFYYCRSLEEHIPQWPAKVTNATYCYSYCQNILPMLNSDGTEQETDYTKIYNSKITTYGNLARYASNSVMNQFYDACVSAGKSGTLYGVAKYTWDV